MKKVFLLATAALLITGVSFADNGKKKKKGQKVNPAALNLQKSAARIKLRRQRFSSKCFLSYFNLVYEVFLLGAMGFISLFSFSTGYKIISISLLCRRRCLP
jgi:hypothetical protein